MGILIVESDDNIGFIIKKNPNTGMIKRQIRNCEMSGFYKKGSSNTYMIYARDFDKCSFESYSDNNGCGNQYNYLNPKIYSSSTFVILAISEFFDTALKKCEGCDTSGVTMHKISINAFPTNNKTLKLIDKLTSYFDMIVTTNTTNGVSVTTFETKNTFHYMLNAIVVIMTVTASMNNENLEVKDSFAKKLVQCVNRVDAPYYVRYFLSSRVLSKYDFQILKSSLEASKKHNIKLFLGDTACQRRTAIEKYLSFKNSIVDIGCGEGMYLFPFSKKLSESCKYIGLDIEEDVLEKLKNKIFKEGITNVSVYDKIDDVITECKKSDETFDIIVTEVIEHMELVDVVPFLQKIIDNIKFDTMIITTPNHNFNVNYIMDTEFRHHDHKWEIGNKEFCDLILTLKLDRKYSMLFPNIGDVVDGESCTSCCVISKLK
jgi:2-polyprenyl-3-methyl-5-hydroxy-6-metoxy-1,4-benzoquinol methylase